jgi:hypothetical protein
LGLKPDSYSKWIILKLHTTISQSENFRMGQKGLCWRIFTGNGVSKNITCVLAACWFPFNIDCFLAALSFNAFAVVKTAVVFPPLFWVVCDLVAAELLVVRVEIVVVVAAAAIAGVCGGGTLFWLPCESIVQGNN